MDPLQTLILQISAGVFISAVGGTLAVVATIRALRYCGQVVRHERERRQEARIREHVQTLLRQEIVTPLDHDTVTMPVLGERELRMLARHEEDFINRRYR